MVNYPPVGFHFSVNFELNKGDAGAETGFQEVQGIEATLESKEHKEGGENRFVHTLPQRTKYSNLILKRGLLTDSAVIGWVKNAIEDLDIEPISLQVTLLNETHEPLAAYNFVNVWPKKWSVSDLNAERNEIVVESLELVYQYFKKL